MRAQMGTSYRTMKDKRPSESPEVYDTSVLKLQNQDTEKGSFHGLGLPMDSGGRVLVKDLLSRKNSYAFANYKGRRVNMDLETMVNYATHGVDSDKK